MERRSSDLSQNDKMLLRDAVMNLNLEKRVSDVKFQKHVRTDRNFINQLKFLYNSLVQSEIDFVGLVKNQRFASGLNEYEIHYLIVKAALQECEERIKELMTPKPDEKKSNLLRDKPDLTKKLLDFQYKKKESLVFLEQKFLRRLKREDQFDAGKIKFRIPGPESVTKAFPYYSYKKNRFKVLKCANVGYVEKYVKNGQNMEYSGLGKLKAKEKQEEERERQAILQRALDAKREAAQAAQKAAEEASKQVVMKMPADMNESDWMEEQLKRYEEDQEKKRLHEKWGSAENCLHYLHKVRRKLIRQKVEKVDRPPMRSPEKKPTLLAQRRPSSASSRLSRFALQGQKKEDDTLSADDSSVPESDDKLFQSPGISAETTLQRSSTPKITRDTEKHEYKKQNTIQEDEFGEKNTEESPIRNTTPDIPMRLKSPDFMKLREVHTAEKESMNPLDDFDSHLTSDFGKTTISDFAKTAEGFNKGIRKSLFEIKEHEDIPSKFEEEFNKILNIKNTLREEQEENSSSRRRHLSQRVDDSIQFGSDSDSPRTRTPGTANMTKSSFHPKYRPSTTSHARRAVGSPGTELEFAL